MYSYAAAMEELNDNDDDILSSDSSISGNDTTVNADATNQNWAKVLMSSKSQADADLAVSAMMGLYWTDFAKV
jgi:hypothetical protein